MRKEYGKNLWIKGFWIAILVIVLPSLGSGSPAALLLLLFPIFKILQVFSAKIIISDEHVTIRRGVIFKEVKDIKYKKINSVDITYALGIWWIEIQIGNDKPIVFKNLEKYDEVKELIHQKIDQ